MTSKFLALFEHHMPDPSQFSRGESALMPALLRWLISTGRLRTHTTVAFELPLHGRRVDLALATGRGLTSSFELKIGSIQRVIEQASYNRSSFHRSWMVTGNFPKADGLQWARDLGLGLIVVQDDSVRMLTTPTVTAPHPAALARSRTAISRRGEVFL